MPVADEGAQLVHDAELGFIKRLFEEVFIAVPAANGIYCCVSGDAIQAYSITAFTLTVHETCPLGGLGAEFEQLGARTSVQRGLPSSRALLRLIPEPLRPVFSVEPGRLLSLTLTEHGEFLGFGAFARTANQTPFSLRDFQRISLIAPFIALSISTRSALLKSCSPTAAGLSASEPDSPLAKLPPQERKIALLLVDGYAVANIAVITNLTEHTIRTYIRRVYKKLNVCSRVGLVRLLLASPTNHTSQSAVAVIGSRRPS